jgi:hypothetical protein
MKRAETRRIAANIAKLPELLSAKPWLSAAYILRIIVIFQADPTRYRRHCEEREGVTINIGAKAGGGITRVGERCFHDCDLRQSGDSYARCDGVASRVTVTAQ